MSLGHVTNLANDIDINQSVTPGEDVVINVDGRTYIGTAEEFNKLVESGELVDYNPDYNRPKTFQPPQPLDAESVGTPTWSGYKDETGHFADEPAKKRSATGQFIKQESEVPVPDETPVTEPEVTPEVTPSPEPTPEVAPEVAPEAVPEVAPEAEPAVETPEVPAEPAPVDETPAESNPAPVEAPAAE